MPSLNSINYCPNCGLKIIPNANFCMKCGYELKLLEEIIAKHEITDNSIEEEIEPNVSISLESTNDNTNNEIILDYVDETDNKDETIKEEVNEDFEIVRPDMETSEKEYHSDLESKTNEDNIEKEKNDFNLVRPNSQNVTVKKHKVKKNFSILNQKKF